MNLVVSRENFVNSQQAIAKGNPDPLLAGLRRVYAPQPAKAKKTKPKKKSANFFLALKAEIAQEKARAVIVSMNEIRAAVCEFYNIADQELMSDRRANEAVWARQVAYYLCKQLTPASYPRIGQYFGGRDHATVIHGVRKIESRIADKPHIASDVASIIARLSREAA